MRVVGSCLNLRGVVREEPQQKDSHRNGPQNDPAQMMVTPRRLNLTSMTP